ncbi:STAS domain-containing protein [Wansuia hejianensis]|uniref:Anti-sigma factor antagonist n=1 Tax=Wansuia hejianensis TaxID=2763667 RepID=A0A926F2T9_9FIRM|nr:STAS domain-containing protein [Wansuia hejianensis]MBC8590874.1 STAS domain-containing protein [Wansuia hejianensis]
MSFNITVDYNTEENIWIFRPEGDLDIYTSHKFKEEVNKAFEKKEVDLLIDGEKLEYVDSTGLGVFISILKKVKEKNKQIQIMNIKPNIRKLFDITELDKLFIIRGEDDAK